MRSIKKPQPQVMVASTRPPSVESVSGTSITFRAYYNVNSGLALRFSSLLCNFDVEFKDSVNVPPLVLSSQDSFLCYYASTNKKNTAIERMKQKLATGKSDVTAFIPNDKIKSVAAGAPVRKIKLINTRQSAPGSGISVKPMVSNAITKFAGNQGDANSFGIRQLSRDRKDPAHEINKLSFHVPIKSVMGGIVKLKQLKSIDPKFISFASSQIKRGSAAGVVELTTEDIRDAEASFTFTIDKSKLGIYRVNLRMTRGGNTSSIFYGAIVQDLSFDVDLLKAYSDHTIPTVPPTVQVSDNGPKRLITVKQRDKNGAFIKVFRRDTRDQSAGYVAIANVSAPFGQEVRITDRPEKLGQCIYRAISANEYGASSGVFESRVIAGIKQLRINQEPENVGIVAHETESGVRIRAFNIPTEVMSVALIRRNITLRRGTFDPVLGISGKALVSRSDFTNTALTFQDTPDRPRVTYEYKVRMTWKSGATTDSQKTAVVNFIGDRRTVSAGSISVSTPTVNESSVSFNIQAPRSGQTTDLIIQSLKSRGIDNLYLNELLQNRDRLSDLIAFEVLRFDKVTGENETFGVVSPGDFIDSADTQSAAGVGELIRGHDYIYQIRLLVRSTATIFKQSEVARSGQVSDNGYSTPARKFLSPDVLNRGTLASNADDKQTKLVDGIGEKPRMSGDMIAGSTSLVTAVEAKIPPDDDDIKNITAELGETNIIRWQVVPGTRPIDHIVIQADYNGVLAPHQSLHFSNSGEQVYKDEKLSASAGTLKYYLQIVYSDFTRSALFGPAQEV